MIDLHLHSTFSDGSMTPASLVVEAKDLGLTAIALTDHDIVDGIPEFMDSGRKWGIITVPGVEISVDTKLPNNGHMHILGLFIDYNSKKMKNIVDNLRKERNLRGERIIRRLNDLSVAITMEELLEEAGEGSIGRPHLAKILVRKQVVSSTQKAFDVYLGKGRPAYIDKVKLGESDAIKMVKDAGGLAILAHPHLMKYDTFEETQKKIMELKDLGLDGIEAYHTGMSEFNAKKLQKLAKTLDLAVSGGSDFHGANKEGISMGSGKKNLNIPDHLIVQLEARWKESKKKNREND